MRMRIQLRKVSDEILITNTIINIIRKIKVFKHFFAFQKSVYLKGQSSANLVPFLTYMDRPMPE
jgi:hypothetical protein